MSEPTFFPPAVPMMTPERARDLARSWKAMSEHTEGMGDKGGARFAERQSHWWLAYAVALAQTKEEPGA